MNRLVVLAICLTFGCIAGSEKKDTVRLTLFYESYCPYSVDFIVKQLYGTWEEFKHHMKLNLVPFGNAEQTYDNGHFNFTCQHGPKECEANILHACAIHEACGGKRSFHCPVHKLAKAMKYILCVVKQDNQTEASDECATSAGLVPNVINRCANGELGNRLESFYGNETAAFNNPPVTYVPFIVIDHKHNETEQNEAETDLKALICEYIPDQCKSPTTC